MKNSILFLLAFLSSFVVIFIFAFSPNDTANKESKAKVISNEKNLNESEITENFLPSKLDFCGEVVPLFDDEVKERLDREMTINVKGLLATNTLILKKTKRYFPMFDSILNA